MQAKVMPRTPLGLLRADTGQLLHLAMSHHHHLGVWNAALKTWFGPVHHSAAGLVPLGPSRSRNSRFSTWPVGPMGSASTILTSSGVHHLATRSATWAF